MNGELLTGGSAQEVVSALGLAPHPEGGWYRETWRATAQEGERGAGTAILFLLRAGEVSRWHRVDASEVWLFMAGDPLTLRTAIEDGAACEHRLGRDLAAGARLQHVVAPGEWQSARSEGAWSLVSCVVAPAFEFSGFELAPEGWEPGPAPPGSP